MKIKQIIIAFAIAIPILAMTNTASNAAKFCLIEVCGPDAPPEPYNNELIEGCLSYSDECMNGKRIRSCNRCNGNLVLTSTPIGIPGCTNTTDFNTCLPPSQPDDCTGVCSTGTTYTTIGGTNCKTSETAACYGTQKLLSCKTCPTNYTLTTKSVITDSCGTKTYNTCVQDSSPCDGTCTDCISKLKWIQLGDGVESRTTKTCNTSTCECLSNTEFRCIKGYYGTAMAAQLNNCIKCPGSGTSIAGSNDSITNCYATSGEDATGKYDYEQFCYYSE